MRRRRLPNKTSLLPIAFLIAMFVVAIVLLLTLGDVHVA